jgi:hypothetical protein
MNVGEYIDINLQEVGFDVWIELAYVCVRSLRL